DGDHEQAVLVTSSGVERKIPLIAVPENGSLHVRVPLDMPETARVLDGRSTRHWVFAGLADPLASGGIMALRETATLRAGGGAASACTPRVYDILVPDGYTQAAVLSSYDDAMDRLAVIPPLVAGGFDPARDYRDAAGNAGNASADEKASLVASLALKVKSEREQAEAAGKISFEAALSSSDASEKAEALFMLGRYDECMVLLETLLADKPDNPVALAFKGSLTAMKGGTTGNPAEAVRFVQESYAFLDRAVDLAGASGSGNIDALVIALTNRANVSASVPDEVFGKMRQAASDYERLAELFSKSGDAAGAADAYCSTGVCLEKLGKDAEARVAFLRALSIQDRHASVSLELAKRGYLK
ncbi:MAG: glucodextranase DOMON-like domain-containing protein, partial [Syntrophales bacterium]|nr:glucodextranase DOMON-like domain-containing protein [Syntrophales bacterium]